MNKPINVDFVDFAIAALLFESVFVESIHHGDDKNLETRAVVERISESKHNEPVSATDLAKELQISKAQAYARLRRAQLAGAVVRVNKPERGNKKLYAAAPRPRFLPDPQEVFQQIPALGPKVRFAHPLSGEWIVYRRKRRAKAI